MKYLVSFSLLLMMAIVVVFWTSCDKQSCEDIVCNGNNATCVNGRCGCIQGFEGPNCDTYSYEKYVGNYQVSENCTTTLSGNTNNQYGMFISLGNNVDRVVINNFLGIGPIDCYINANNLVIPAQNLGATTVEGYGEYFPEIRQLRLEFQYTQGSQFGQCTAIMTKI